MKRYEVLWYEHHDDEEFYEITHTKEFSTKQAALNFFNKIKDNTNFYGFWVTKRNSHWEVVEDYII